MTQWVECQICPKYCRIAPGRSGDCRIRVNLDGKLVATTYGYPTSIHIDPIEKKPLFHFLPGSSILSVATVGCNLHCKGCQNHEISQANPEQMDVFQMSPAELVALTLEKGCPSIAYTYTEPVAFYEYTLDCSVAAKEAGLHSVLVTAGYINETPLRNLAPFVKAANVDVKAFSDAFYRDYCGATLKPVLRAVEILLEMGVWVELTYLVIPTLNDSEQEVQSFVQWVKQTLGRTVPVHFSRFFPQHRMQNLPPTPPETLLACRQIAQSEGLAHVYLGNLRTPGSEDTFCANPECPDTTTPLVKRAGFRILSNRIQQGLCPSCRTPVAGIWS